MWIIVEGVDKAGKSTLCRRLVKALKTRDDRGSPVYEEFGPPDPDREMYDQYGRDWDVYDPARDAHRVFSRFHWGERVYGPLKRADHGGDRLGEAGFRWVELTLAARGVLCILLEDELDVLQTRFETDGEDFSVVSEIPTIVSGFRAVNDSSVLTAFAPLVTREHDLNALVDRLISIGDRLAENAVYVSSVQSYIGTPSPKYLLFGDTHHNPYGLPLSAHHGAFLPLKNHSGEYLLTSLPADMWRQCAIVNSAQAEDRLHNLWIETGCPRVVALGAAAHKRLDKEEVPHGVVPHPQKVRRFHYAMRKEYGQKIIDVATTGRDCLRWPE